MAVATPTCYAAVTTDMNPFLLAFLVLLAPLPFTELPEEEPGIELAVVAKSETRVPLVRPTARTAAVATPIPGPDRSAPPPSRWTPRPFSRPPPA